MTGVAEPEVLRALFVTYGVLDALDVKPLLGRWFSPADDTPGSPETVILTYGYWQRRFGGDQSILGRTLTINSTAHTVIGVMPEEFRFQRDPVLILPARFERSKVNWEHSATRGLRGSSPASRLRRPTRIWLACWNLVERLASATGIRSRGFQNARFGPKIQPLKQEIVGDVGTALWVVMGTLGLVLLIVCANVANLFLVRTETRRQELAIRAALGAGWRRIAREMLVECMTLGVLGGTLGLGLAYAALRILVAKGPATLPRLNEIGIDPLVLAFALGVSVLSGALFGLIPVLKYAGARVASHAPRRRPDHRPKPGTQSRAEHPGRGAGGARAGAVGRLRPDDSHVSAVARRAARIHAPRRDPNRALLDPGSHCRRSRARDADVG